MPSAASADYLPRIEGVSFHPSELPERCITISVVEDEIVENDETFSIALSSSDSTVTFNSTQATVTILDDEDSKLHNI